MGGLEDIELAPLRNQPGPSVNYPEIDADLEHLLTFDRQPTVGEDDAASESKAPGTNGPHGQSSVAKAAFNMTKTIVGAGVFGLPFTFQKAGNWG
jgi:hypothetical protein